MTVFRKRLLNRRAHDVVEFEFCGTRYFAGFSRFEGGGLAEIFLSTNKPSSGRDIEAHDAAILCSLCLQHAVPLATIRHALLSDQDGAASGALARAIDLIEAAAYAQR